jgi:putative transposase
MPQSYCALYYHYIFSTKDRAPLIGLEWQPRLFEYIGGLCRERKSHLIAAGGMHDHVHLLVSMNKEESVSAFMREIKSISSGWIHDSIPRQMGFAWQNGYGAFTVSKSKISEVQQYIAQQQEHHRKKTFQEEFLEFLIQNEIDYDPKYIWD